MAAALVASVGAGSVDAATCVTAATDFSAANGIVVAMSSYSSIPATGVNDNIGGSPNTYIGLTGQDAGGPRIQIYYCINPTVSAAMTHHAVGGGYQCLIVFGFSGANISVLYDGNESTSQPTSQAGSITPSENDCVIVQAVSIAAGTNAYTIDGGFSQPVAGFGLAGGQHFGLLAGYLIQTTAAAANPSWSGPATTFASAIASFRSGAAPPPSNPFSAANIAVW